VRQHIELERICTDWCSADHVGRYSEGRYTTSMRRPTPCCERDVLHTTWREVGIRSQTSHSRPHGHVPPTRLQSGYTTADPSLSCPVLCFRSWYWSKPDLFSRQAPVGKSLKLGKAIIHRRLSANHLPHLSTTTTLNLPVRYHDVHSALVCMPKASASHFTMLSLSARGTGKDLE
jgi:hypothetical protein